MMPRLTLIDAEGIANRNRPWTIRLEFHCGTVSKYLYATGRGIDEEIEIGWGDIGFAPQYQIIDWDQLRILVADKRSLGYQWADTSYIRMSKGSLSSLSGGSSIASPVRISSSSQVSSTNSSISSLSQPFSLTQTMRIMRDGVKLIGYVALDASGNELFQMPPIDGLQFAQKYNIEIKFA